MSTDWIATQTRVFTAWVNNVLKGTLKLGRKKKEKPVDAPALQCTGRSARLW